MVKSLNKIKCKNCQYKDGWKSTCVSLSCEVKCYWPQCNWGYPIQLENIAAATQVYNSGILTSWEHKIPTYMCVPACTVGLGWVISRDFFWNQWHCDSIKWKFLRSPIFHWTENLTLHLFLIDVSGPLEFFAWRSQNQVLSLEMDASIHRTRRVCALCCHYHSIPWRSDFMFYLCREQYFLNLQRTHDAEETSTTVYNSILWIIPVMDQL